MTNINKIKFLNNVEAPKAVVTDGLKVTNGTFILNSCSYGYEVPESLEPNELFFVIKDIVVEEPDEITCKINFTENANAEPMIITTSKGTTWQEFLYQMEDTTNLTSDHTYVYYGQYLARPSSTFKDSAIKYKGVNVKLTDVIHHNYEYTCDRTLKEEMFLWGGDYSFTHDAEDCGVSFNEDGSITISEACGGDHYYALSAGCFIPAGTYRLAMLETSGANLADVNTNCIDVWINDFPNVNLGESAEFTITEDIYTSYSGENQIYISPDSASVGLTIKPILKRIS